MSWVVSVLGEMGFGSGLSRVALILVAALSIAFFWQRSELKDARAELSIEKLEHTQSRLELAEAVRENMGWAAAMGTSAVKITALQGQNSACLERENQARTDAADRADIMGNADPRTMTEQDKLQGVDDATRRKAADRLNRPL